MRKRIDTTLSEETIYGLKVIARRLTPKLMGKAPLSRAIEYLVRKELSQGKELSKGVIGNLMGFPLADDSD